MEIETLNNVVSEESIGEKLVADLCRISSPNAGEYMWKFGKKVSADDKGVVMIFGLHGDEVGPVEALKILLPQIAAIQSELRGEITLILGSPQAVRKGERGVEVDPNRVFGKSGLTVDHQRVGQIQQAIIEANADVLIDYHCTRNKSEPFVFVPKGFENHEDLLTKQMVAAHKLGAVVLADWSTYTDSANEVDHWSIQVSEGAMKAITVEAGWLKCDAIEDPNGPVQITVKGVVNALGCLGICNIGHLEEIEVLDGVDTWDIFDGVYSGKGFRWNGVVRNFGKFLKGEIYAYQDGMPLCAEEDFATMFVKNNGDFNPDDENQRVALMMRHWQ